MRYEQNNNKSTHRIAIGIDHAIGLFFQVWKLNPDFPVTAIENMPDPSNIVFDEDHLFNKLTKQRVIDKCKEYDVAITKKIAICVS